MAAPEPPLLHELSDGDVVSRPLEPPSSKLAATGIEFQGLESSYPIPTRDWKGTSEPH